MKTYVTVLNFEKYQNSLAEAGRWSSPFDPLQPQNYPKKCNSVTLRKKAEIGRNYWLHFWLHFLIDIKKNCNQLVLSSGYKFKIEGYNSFKKHFVTVTILKINKLIKKTGPLQNYNFLVQTQEEQRFVRL